MKNSGFSLIEVIVGTAILSIIFAGGASVLLVAQASWTTTNTNIQLQENARLSLTKIAKELQESGTDENDILQITIFDNTGVNGSDVIRFSIPICLCGEEVINDDGDVANWGAPVKWGSNGCTKTFTVDTDNTITLCHVVSTDPLVTNTLKINESDLSDYVDNGDWPGACTDCDTDENKFIQYQLNNNNQLVRQVLDKDAALESEDLVAVNITDFQTVLSADSTNVTVTINLQRSTNNKRVLTLTRSQTVYLRN